VRAHQRHDVPCNQPSCAKLGGEMRQWCGVYVRPAR
jgi:hypothetical protein